MELNSRRGLVALLLIFALTGCTVSSDPSSTPETPESTQPPAERSAPASTPPTVDPHPSEGAAPDDDPAPTAAQLSWQHSAGVTYLVADQGDSDAIAHEVIFRIDEGGCLRADVADRGEGLFVALHPGYVVSAKGIESDEGAVAQFGEPVSAQQMAAGAVPAEYEERCGPTQPTSIFAPESISGR
ncbi:hypothetical protein [Agrococcus sp. Marseille-Q4369]|uniref:hypothetical protein n=1 Tax=Agrococcus sp. Marseille-Q4369 TaxID=2810513 RepID=UPI001B8CC26B|nr:hypothetical protein [Agrococcus sp. Marseille-Q4369]QUW18644.1 hypothetical protein JSQ78_12775 [Agrococcus sp. Marseille-Q4369]